MSAMKIRCELQDKPALPGAGREAVWRAGKGTHTPHRLVVSHYDGVCTHINFFLLPISTLTLLGGPKLAQFSEVCRIQSLDYDIVCCCSDFPSPIRLCTVFNER